MCVGLSYLVKVTYISTLKNINVDDVIEGLWTNDFVFVFIHRWFFELPIVITFLFTVIRSCKAMSTPEALKKLCLNLRCQRNSLLLAKVSFSLTSITPTHFWQFWESWLIQTLPAVLRLSKQNERLASDDYIMCPCDTPQPSIFSGYSNGCAGLIFGLLCSQKQDPFLCKSLSIWLQTWKKSQSNTETPFTLL